MKSILRPNISFNVKRGEPVVIVPAKSTPHDIKSLSDIDDQATLRFYAPSVLFYHANPNKAALDPATVIKEALAKALVYYYPIAGRLREQPGGNLVVDCNGEGVMFVEAEADVRLDYLGDPITPPLPFIDQLEFDSELMGTGVVDKPLLYVQVTRFKCGGFTYGTNLCHIMADASGSAQFQSAIAELARGAEQPSVLPVWERHLLLAREPPVPTHIHREYEPDGATEEEYDAIRKNPPANIVYRSFFFGPSEISALRKHVQSFKQSSHVSRFDLITAAVWRSRTIALDYNPDNEVRVQFTVNSRGKLIPQLPTGFYGNAFARAVAFDKAGKLCSNPFEYALNLVKEAKKRATSSDFLQSLADMLVLRGRPRFMVSSRAFLVSDLTHGGFNDVDFGWGEGMYGTKPIPWIVTFYSRFTNSTGEEIMLVPMCLPEPAMARFITELENLLQA